MSHVCHAVLAKMGSQNGKGHTQFVLGGHCYCHPRVLHM